MVLSGGLRAVGNGNHRAEWIACRDLLFVTFHDSGGFVVLLALACIAVALCPIDLPGWIVMSVWCSAGTGMAGMVLAPVLLRRTTRFAKARRLAEQSLIYLDRPRLMIATTVLSLFI